MPEHKSGEELERIEVRVMSVGCSDKDARWLLDYGKTLAAQLAEAERREKEKDERARQLLLVMDQHSERSFDPAITAAARNLDEALQDHLQEQSK
jgi:hypothetical protein